jgi:hypothetical protein
MNRHLIRIIAVAVLGVLVSAEADAGGTAKRLAERTWSRIFARDAARDAALPVRPLREPRRVWRYSDRAGAARATSGGLPPGSHMTTGTTPGRLPSPARAQERYGLARPPEVRMTIDLPRGHPVRQGKAIGGSPGVGEITSPARIPPGSIVKVDPLPGARQR